MARIAVYAGSFDPVTNGHLDVITRGAALFDTLYVAVGNNPAKRYLLDLDTRSGLVTSTTAHLSNVEVTTFDGLLVHKTAELGASVILRGLRALSDFDLEFRNGLANRELSGIETLFILSEPELIYVSSSLVKEIAANGGDASPFVPDEVLEVLTKRYAKPA